LRYFVTHLSKTNKFLLAVAVLVFFSFLFCIPGSAIPKDDWLDKIWADKWVHIGIFTSLIFLWSNAFEINVTKGFFILVFVAVLYGFAVEIVQDQFITNRSFDLGDLLADFIGCLGGVWLRTRYIKK
jgi:VanZ family protein